jgi:hypothetical protein
VAGGLGQFRHAKAQLGRMAVGVEKVAVTTIRASNRLRIPSQNERS